MKRIINISIVALFMVSAPLMLKAQKIKAGDTITNKRGVQLYIKDELSQKMKIIAQAWLLNLECGTGDAFRLGAGLEGDYFLPKLVSIHGTFIKSYFSIQKMTAGSDNKSDNSFHGFSLIELGGRFHIIDRQGRKRHKLILSSSTGYSMGTQVTTEHYVRVKMPCRRILAARGGLYRTSAPVSTNMNANELKVSDNGAVKTKDGTVLSNTYFTTGHTTGFYLGISDVVNMSVRTRNNVSGYSDYTYFSSLFREAYADVILAATSFDPFVVSGKSYAIEPNTSGSFQTSKIGWRVGKKLVYTRRTLNMGFSFELGNRPGVAGRGLFFGTGMSVAFVK